VALALTLLHPTLWICAVHCLLWVGDPVLGNPHRDMNPFTGSTSVYSYQGNSGPPNQHNKGFGKLVRGPCTRYACTHVPPPTTLTPRTPALWVPSHVPTHWLRKPKALSHWTTQTSPLGAFTASRASTSGSRPGAMLIPTCGPPPRIPSSMTRPPCRVRGCSGQLVWVWGAQGVGGGGGRGHTSY
jgi:hypothetical protein